MLFTSLIQNKQFIKYIITNYKDKTINTIICIVKMSQKSVHSLNIQNKSPIKNNPFCDEDHTEVPSKISTSKKLPLTSPMFSYFSDSHVRIFLGRILYVPTMKQRTTKRRTEVI